MTAFALPQKQRLLIDSLAHERRCSTKSVYPLITIVTPKNHFHGPMNR